MKQTRNPVIFLRGKKVILRPLREEDAELSYRWVNDPDVWENLTIFLPTSIEAEREWVRGLHKDHENIVLAIETRGGRYIGNIGLHRINWKDRTAISGALIGEKEYRGKGYGTDAKMVLLHYAFNILNFRKVCSQVVADNGLSLGFNKKCGYKPEGRLVKQTYRGGRYKDEILLAVFKEDWLPLWEKYNKGLKK